MSSVQFTNENIVPERDYYIDDQGNLIKKAVASQVLGDVSNFKSTTGVAKPTNVKVAVASRQSEIVKSHESADQYQQKIDSKDRGNPQAVSQYASNIVKHWLKVEKKFCVNPNYMASQQYITYKMREILLDWLTDVHIKFKLVPETMYLTTNIIDRYLEKNEISKHNLQLVGVTSMLIASKYEEIYFPEISDFSYITDQAYTPDQIRTMEGQIVNSLQFEFTVPTIYNFLQRYLKVCEDNPIVAPMACYIAHRSLQAYSMLKYTPSVKAASSVYLARKYLHITPAWSPLLERFTQISIETITDCVKEMHLLMHSESRLTAVKKLYSTSRYQRVASLVP
ncbi:hypothetical protein WA158_004276 [Blastocystis sp. Blastoise]